LKYRKNLEIYFEINIIKGLKEMQDKMNDEIKINNDEEY
jgi:hypothetical protein